VAKYTYTFNDGHKTTSDLPAEEVIKRMDRLSHLIMLLEGFDEGSVYNDIYKKALAAYNKTDNFTGRIRLSFTEKDNLGYLLDREMNTEEDIKVLKYYLR
jgi:hypothetical protein